MSGRHGGDPTGLDAPVSAVPLRLADPERAVEWETIYRENVVTIYRLMYGKVGNSPDAEDLTSQVFVNALPHLRAGASGGEAYRYILATAKTVLANHWRRRLGIAVTELDEGSVTAPAPAVVTGPDKSDRVNDVLGRLPQNYRTILELRFLSGCSIKEAASEMGISVSNAKVIQHRALRRAAELGSESPR
jgi:RNA polymerase sigma-70 factor (ECF subfamily)